MVTGLDVIGVETSPTMQIVQSLEIKFLITEISDFLKQIMILKYY